MKADQRDLFIAKQRKERELELEKGKARLKSFEEELNGLIEDKKCIDSDL